MAADELEERAEGRTRVVGRGGAAEHVVELVRAHGSLHAAAEAGSVRALSGRGTPHVLPTPLGAWVVRRYRRGGAVAVLVEDLYLRVGRPRPLAELAVSDMARARGVPTPRVMAVTLEAVGPAFRSDIAVELVPDASDLAAILFGAASLRQARLGAAPESGDAPAAMREAGRLLHLLHARGLRHPDLNLKNILVQRGVGGARAWVVDLDRATVGGGPVGAAGRRRMLRRFERSLRKWERAGGRPASGAARAAFHEGYAEGAGAAPAG